jgi:tryptophanase
MAKLYHLYGLSPRKSQTIIEPFRIKTTEPVKMISQEERIKALDTDSAARYLKPPGKAIFL